MTDAKSPSAFQLLAPLHGLVIPLEEVPDPVFAQKVVGDGLAIDPLSQTLVAPCAGRIVQLHAANHAVGIETEHGAQILLHIGIDTVKLKGKGFTPRVRLGDSVKAGQPLIDFDADEIARNAKSLITLMIVTEPGPYGLKLRSTQQRVVPPGEVLADMTPTSGEAGSASTAPSERATSAPVQIKLPTGLHARPGALLAGTAKKFKSKISIKKNAQIANAKSVVGIMGLEIAYGDQVTFEAEGPDAKSAVHDVAEFLRHLEEKAETPPPSGATRATVASALSQSPSLILGVAASPGLAVGRVHQLRAEKFDIPENSSEGVNAEQTRLNSALHKGATELQELQKQLKSRTEAHEAAIFDAHQELLEDPDLIDEASSLIKKGKTAAFAWQSATSRQAERLANLNNELMAQRANDLRDVGRRVLRILVGKAQPILQGVESGVILIAENLTPSDTAQLDRSKVLAFATTTGGATSHIAILARSLGLPALAGIEARALQIAVGTEVVLDGDRGELRLNPGMEEKTTIHLKQTELAERRLVAMKSAHQVATTRDGHTIEIAANIGGAKDARKAVELGCDAVGLLRSEFLFMGRTTAPTEEEQYRVYQEIADILGERPLTIRTLDVGGDKPLQYLPIPAEENPFLGIRGLRVGLLQDKEILREQLRAILRVKSRGKLNIMFPMVSVIEEFREAKAILEEERARLGAAPVQVGIMIEVPSAALMAEAFAPEVDFFSIGTNDLTQYTMAMDRGHKDLAKMLDSLHPSVLKLIEMTAQAAHRHGKWVGVCGGVAGDAKAVPILIGLGIDELSVSIPVIPLVKAQVRETTVTASKALAQSALQSRSAREVRDLTGV